LPIGSGDGRRACGQAVDRLQCLPCGRGYADDLILKVKRAAGIFLLHGERVCSGKRRSAADDARVLEGIFICGEVAEVTPGRQRASQPNVLKFGILQAKFGVGAPPATLMLLV
jgi:hypothetical protein